MTCAQGLLRLLWGGPEVGVLRDWVHDNSTAQVDSANKMGPKHWLLSFWSPIVSWQNRSKSVDNCIIELVALTTMKTFSEIRF